MCAECQDYSNNSRDHGGEKPELKGVLLALLTVGSLSHSKEACGSQHTGTLPILILRMNGL